ncbi:hypothetical protein J31TS4_02520 [Paenibacillus sp. J31TS4]|uniref:YdcF family protein n=1 Tax=Paenibacillus sp. J31TS4 TaxID=2807195 RepID=UPI001B272BF6|nr:YdcF family protein [Paenibacillus sp. J31TS4]GIP36972.1 hypothetical protein J31TS4_02520 [Paenibacillus sp. J31TS4]
MARLSELDPVRLTDAQMERMLFDGLEDNGSAADCILVFGSKHSLKYRVPHAVRLYQAGRAPRILMSGGVVWPDDDRPEAVRMKEEAVRLGVPEASVFTETQSLHTKENVLASLLALDRCCQLHELRSILLVTTSYHMRRCLLTCQTYMPSWLTILPSPVNDETTRRDNWHSNPRGRLLVEQEASKLVGYVRSGVLLDAAY